MPPCKRIIYRGRVQGVGFRYTALDLSRKHAVSGTVRNCSDGSVELVVQGETDQVQAFLAALAALMGDLIAERSSHDHESPAIQGFHIIR